MPALPRVSYPGKQAWIGMIISGAQFLVVGALLGWVFLAGGLLLFAFMIPTHGHQPLPKWLLAPELWYVMALSGASFFAAFSTASSRWAFRPALSSFLACTLCLIMILCRLDRPWGPDRELLLLLAPLIFAPLGGLAGERVFGKD